ncbi:MAG: hypothetical protein AB8G22_21050 [Saprospiraceae bacterium]
MRIIGYIEHPHLKVTVFKMDNKLSVKFESGLYEQTYKFRMTEQLETLEDVKKLVDMPFLLAVEEELQRMHRVRNAALSRKIKTSETNEFPTII